MKRRGGGLIEHRADEHERTAGDAEDRTRVNGTLRDLSELIVALDRRVPQLERSGEASIARAAAKLKDEAVKRIADLERRHLQ
jgi:hypothetical protein